MSKAHARGVSSTPATPRAGSSSGAPSPAPATARASVANSTAAGGVPDLDSTLQLPQKHNPITSASTVTLLRCRPFNQRELRQPVAVIEGSSSVAAIVSGAAAKHMATGIIASGDDTVPEPCVDVESDGKTVALLDPAKGYAVKTTFTFDYCFSPFVAVDLGFGGTNNSSMGSPARAAAAATAAGTGGGGKNGKSNNSSDDDDDEAEKEQEKIFELVGRPVVDQALSGVNSCVWAYGMTSSGKSYTMLGTKTEPGIIPRVCRALFQRIEADQLKRDVQHLSASANNNNNVPASPLSPSSPASLDGGAAEKMIKIEVVYMEIYNERVRDLLRPRTKSTGPGAKRPKWDVGTTDEEFLSLKVRQHPLHGPFVDGLTKLQVNTWLDCVRLIRQGNELRMTCTTDMNDSSSRSHAIFQLLITQTEAFGAKVRGKDIVNHRTAKINLVDLAGSERSTQSKAQGKHATEANYINTSLSTLRKVIDVLNSKKKMSAAQAEKIVVPYRESLLTWLLSDNFGGNSKTAMIANVSPHWSCVHETESTLRYATLARGIVNRCRVNEDPSAKLIRELQTQLRNLQDELRRGGTPGHGGGATMTREIEEQMEENKRALQELEAKEDGMMEVIRESREREEKLRIEKEGLERDQQRWKREAERLAREKVELLARLEKHERGGLGPKGDAFWHDEYGQSPATSPAVALAGIKGASARTAVSRGGDDSDASAGPSPTATARGSMNHGGGGSGGLDDSFQESSASSTILNDSIAVPAGQPKRIIHRRRSSAAPEVLANNDSSDKQEGDDSHGTDRNEHSQSQQQQQPSPSSSTFLTDSQQQHPHAALPKSRESRTSRQSNRIDSRGQDDRDPSEMLLGSLIGDRRRSSSNSVSVIKDGDDKRESAAISDKVAIRSESNVAALAGSRESQNSRGSSNGGGGAVSSSITPSRLAGGSLLAQLGGASGVAAGASSTQRPAASPGCSPAATPAAAGNATESHHVGRRNVISSGAASNTTNTSLPSPASLGVPPLPPTVSPPGSRGAAGGLGFPLSLGAAPAAAGVDSTNNSGVFNATGGSSTSSSRAGEIKSGRRKNV